MSMDVATMDDDDNLTDSEDSDHEKNAQDPSIHLSILEHYEFLGRVLGKALYESILVEPQLRLSFLNQLLGNPNSLEDHSRTLTPSITQT